jgi:hypothetical protein
LPESVYAHEGSCEKGNFFPDGVQRVVGRIKAAFQINEFTAVFRKLVIQPLQNIIGKQQQFVGMILWVIPVEEIQGKKKIEILGHKKFPMGTGYHLSYKFLSQKENL